MNILYKNNKLKKGVSLFSNYIQFESSNSTVFIDFQRHLNINSIEYDRVQYFKQVKLYFQLEALPNQNPMIVDKNPP